MIVVPPLPLGTLLNGIWSSPFTVVTEVTATVRAAMICFRKPVAVTDVSDKILLVARTIKAVPTLVIVSNLPVSRVCVTVVTEVMPPARAGDRLICRVCVTVPGLVIPNAWRITL